MYWRIGALSPAGGPDGSATQQVGSRALTADPLHAALGFWQCLGRTRCQAYWPSSGVRAAPLQQPFFFCCPPRARPWLRTLHCFSHTRLRPLPQQLRPTDFSFINLVSLDSPLQPAIVTAGRLASGRPNVAATFLRALAHWRGRPSSNPGTGDGHLYE